MTALKTPSADAPAAAWGAFAESIPGWRNPSPTAVLDSLAMPRIEVGFPVGDLPHPRFVIDPDHWAWWGWFILLLGPERIQVTMWGDEITVGTDNLVMEPSAFGRACIAAAAANGRWPGGDL